MQPQSSTTSQLITALLPQLTEGDRVRLLHFAQAMIQQRTGKRQRRAKRFHSELPDQDWMIGK